LHREFVVTVAVDLLGRRADHEHSYKRHRKRCAGDLGVLREQCSTLDQMTSALSRYLRK
jgi:hypothetical protein